MLINKLLVDNFSGFSVSLLFGRRYVIPWQNHFGAKLGSFITLLKFIASCAWIDERVSSQKCGIWSIPGDFHLRKFFRASLISSTVISSHSCFRNIISASF